MCNVHVVHLMVICDDDDGDDYYDHIDNYVILHENIKILTAL